MFTVFRNRKIFITNQGENTTFLTFNLIIDQCTLYTVLKITKVWILLNVNLIQR